MSVRRLSLPVMMLALAACLATVSAFVSWDSVYASASGGFGLGVYGVGGWSALRWDGLSPSVTLRLVMVVAAWSLVVLVHLRRRLGIVVTLPVVLVLAVALGSGDPAPTRFTFGSAELRVAFGAGYWLAMSALVLALITIAAELIPALVGIGRRLGPSLRG